MFELVLSMIARLIELVKRQEEQKKSLYSDFVSPIIADFENIHKDYLESFR